MRTHMKGTKGRAVCGIKITKHTAIAKNNEDATCTNCLGRCYTDLDMFFEYKRLKNAAEEMINFLCSDEQRPGPTSGQGLLKRTIALRKAIKPITSIT